MTATLLCLVLADPAGAQAWDLAGSSLRDVGMAGAGAAAELPGAAMQVDPASVAGINGETATLSWRGSFPSVTSSTGDDLVTDPIHAVDMVIGLARPIGESTAVGGGLSMYLPLPNLVSTLVHSSPTDPQAPLLEDAADFAAFDLAIGVRVGQLELALGSAIGLSLLAETDIGLLTLQGEETKDGFDISDSVTLDLRRELTWRVTPLVGAHYRGEDWNAYISWRGMAGFETTGDQLLEVNIPVIEIEPVEIPVTYLSAWSPGRLTAAFSAEIDRMRPELIVRYVVGSTFLDTQQRSPREPFVNVVSPGAGLAVDLGNGIEGRTGYTLMPTVVPAQTGATRFADATRHGIGLGGALKLDDAPRGGDVTEFAVAGQLQLLSPRSDGFVAEGHWLTVTAGVKTGF